MAGSSPGDCLTHLSGDPAEFAFGVNFFPDPDSGKAVTSEESASWGCVQLWVHGRNVCAHTVDGELSEAVCWYLLPMLEWFATVWEPLFHEERLPDRNAGIDAMESLNRTARAPRNLTSLEAMTWEEEWYAWWTRHSLAAAALED